MVTEAGRKRSASIRPSAYVPKMVICHFLSVPQGDPGTRGPPGIPGREGPKVSFEDSTLHGCVAC